MIAKITRMGDPSKVMKAVEILEFKLTAKRTEIDIKKSPTGVSETLVFNGDDEYVEILTNSGEKISTIRVLK